MKASKHSNAFLINVLMETSISKSFEVSARKITQSIKKPSSETSLRLAELVLTLNCFSFGENYYKQINGVAMGTKMGPATPTSS